MKMRNNRPVANFKGFRGASVLTLCTIWKGHWAGELEFLSFSIEFDMSYKLF